MAFLAPPKPAPLEPSLLGTKEYWDRLYTTELSNHASNPSDVGTIWFDDSSAEDKILAFLHSPKLGLDLDTTKFLDLGTGNGHFLFRLREPWPPDADPDDDDDEADDQDNEVRDVEEKEEERAETQPDNDGADTNRDTRKERTEAKNKTKKVTAGFKGPMVGADYSLPSITFAKQVASSLGHDITHLSSPPSAQPRQAPLLTFIHHDILHSPTRELLLPLRRDPTRDLDVHGHGHGHELGRGREQEEEKEEGGGGEEEEEGYDIVLDKGTFDAISLSPHSYSSSSLSSASASASISAARNEEIYAAKILPLLKKHGLFIITSCNWTTEEIRCWFEGMGFRFVDEIRYPSFSFGGRTGQAVCTVCFVKGDEWR